jgi:DNA-binding NarL/FixJ family response regulator
MQTELSPRQRQVAAFVVLGLSNKAIAKRMGISLGSVKQYVQRICERIPGAGRGRPKIFAWWYQRKAA